jgi:hypothetical protein
MAEKERQEKLIKQSELDAATKFSEKQMKRYEELQR